MAQPPAPAADGLAALLDLADRQDAGRGQPRRLGSGLSSTLEAAVEAWFARARVLRRSELVLALTRLAAAACLGERLARRSPGPGSSPHRTLSAAAAELTRLRARDARRQETALQAAVRRWAGPLVPLMGQAGALAHALGVTVGPGTPRLPAPGPGDAWVDLGCGAGQTLEALAVRHAGVRFVGLDLEGVPVGTGGNGRRHVRVPGGDAAAIAAATLDALGPGTCDVVSLCYPSHRRVRTAAGPRLAHRVQLDTALALLRPGGRGVLITEDPIALRTALAHLGEAADAGAVEAWPALVPSPTLREAGVVPYEPRLGELAPLPRGLDGRSLGPFRWGMGVGFRRRQ